jgi:hypothetical protein
MADFVAEPLSKHFSATKTGVSVAERESVGISGRLT